MTVAWRQELPMFPAVAQITPLDGVYTVSEPVYWPSARGGRREGLQHRRCPRARVWRAHGSEGRRSPVWVVWVTVRVLFSQCSGVHFGPGGPLLTHMVPKGELADEAQIRTQSSPA
eukprot:3323833-Prymnesium_polylepis.2